jgi:hypothetical protein
MDGSGNRIAERIQQGLRRLPEDKAGEVLDFVEFLVRRYAGFESSSNPPGVLGDMALDPKDALMEDLETLRALYAEFGEEDRELAQVGLTHYARTLNREEIQHEAG